MLHAVLGAGGLAVASVSWRVLGCCTDARCKFRRRGKGVHDHQQVHRRTVRSHPPLRTCFSPCAEYSHGLPWVPTRDTLRTHTRYSASSASHTGCSAYPHGLLCVPPRATLRTPTGRGSTALQASCGAHAFGTHESAGMRQSRRTRRSMSLHGTGTMRRTNTTSGNSQPSVSEAFDAAASGPTRARLMTRISSSHFALNQS